MTDAIFQLFAITAITIALFVSDRIRLDVVAMMALVAVAFTGVLTPDELTAGFSNSVVLVIAALFVVGEALTRTGVAASVGHAAGRLAGANPLRLVAILMLFTATLSAFMSSTGAVAIMIPVCAGVARTAKMAPGRLLLPVAFAAQIGGTLTLVGTAPNMVAAAALASAGRPELRFQSVTPMGLAMLVAGMIYMLLFVDRRLRRRSTDAEDDRFHISRDSMLADFLGDNHIVRVEVEAEGFCDGTSIRAVNLRRRFDATIIELLRRRQVPDRRGETHEVVPLKPGTKLHAGDVLHLRVDESQVDAMARSLDLRVLEGEPTAAADDSPLGPATGVVEVILPPRSRLVGHTIAERQFRQTYGVNVLAIARLGERITENISSTQLEFGDTLLVSGPWEQIALLRAERRDFLVVGEPDELRDQVAHRSRAPFAIVVTVMMVAAMITGWVSTVEAAIIAAVLLVATRTVPAEEAYRSIQWSTLILIAAMLPLATALEKSGAMDLVVESLFSRVGEAGPVVLLATFALMTSIMSQVVSNTATAVLLAPIAVATARGMDLAPEPFVIAVALAASTAFCTPIASPVNLLVVTPGGFRTRDFLTNGTGLAALMLVVIVLVVPIFYPFR